MEWLQTLAQCEKILSDDEVDALGAGSCEKNVEDSVSSEDEIDEDLQAEYQRLNSILELPADTYSLTKIHPNLPECMKYGVRSGGVHMNMHTFSPFSRGLQGAAIAVAAFATTALIKAHGWSQMVIDQIVEDGDTYYCESYRGLGSHDRRLLTILDLKHHLDIQKTHRVHLVIEEAAYSGVFRPESPTELHLVKALELFFRSHSAGVLTSATLNVSIWREGKYFNIFDGQARRDNLIPDESRGSAKLLLLNDLASVVFIILEKSNIDNDHFVLYPVYMQSIMRRVEAETEDPETGIDPPKRRPSGYMLRGKKALVQSNFHLMHSAVAPELHGRAHLIVALAALVYSRLIHANKWTTAILDLIFNQAHIYLVDLARALAKTIDQSFELMIDDLLGDVILGVYVAKVKVLSNVIPGQAKKGKGKGKSTLDSGLVEFFKYNQSGILEVRKTFYSVWKDNDKYYFLDPFACDPDGCRVDPTDLEVAQTYKNAVACLIMASSVDEIVEIILENTGNTEKDPFFIHALRVLYVKTIADQGAESTVIYREKKTNRRPLPPVSPLLELADDDGKAKVVDSTPKPRINAEKSKEEETQFPELMKDVEEYIMKEDENNNVNENGSDEIVRKSYKIVNSHRLILHGSKNSHSDENLRGRQGISIALSALFYAKLKQTSQWQSLDVDKVIDLGNTLHFDIVNSVGKGVEEVAEEEEEEEEEEDDDDDEIDDDETEEEDEMEESEENDKDDTDETAEIDDIIREKIKNDLDISMIPTTIKYGDESVNLKLKTTVGQGNAEPIVNLGEALERYFNRYDELILENKRLMYPIWKQNGYYFLFNCYGADEEGWRLHECPAVLVVLDSITELVDLLYGIIEFNDRQFNLHFVHVKSIEPKKYRAAVMEIELPENSIEKYETVFLPVTDNDLLALKFQAESQSNVKSESVDEDVSSDEEIDDDNVETEDEEEENGQIESDKAGVTALQAETQSEYDPLTEVEEQEFSNAPSQLNLFLVTTNVNLEDEIVDPKAKESLEYERLKYNHPPPYVLPPNKVLATLLQSKKASKSVSSLVSCFSIDSKLAVQSDLPPLQSLGIPSINTHNGEETSKMIKLPPSKYLFSRVSPLGFTPLRAINEKFIHDEHQVDKTDKPEFKKSPGDFYLHTIPESHNSARIIPIILPLGPPIKTPTAFKKLKACTEKKNRKCKLSEAEKKDKILNEFTCNTENILLEMMFQTVKEPLTKSLVTDNLQVRADSFNEVAAALLLDDMSDEYEEDENEEEYLDEDLLDEMEEENSGFFQDENDKTVIIRGNMKLDRDVVQPFHVNSSFFAGILVILAKTQIEVNKFNSQTLDTLILFADKIYQRIGSLTLKAHRIFNNLELFNVKFNIILKQIRYADPQNHPPDALPHTLPDFLNKYLSGILVFENASYAFWVSDTKYYLFEPFACDKSGHASKNGTACLLQYEDIFSLIQRLQKYTWIDTNKPYRIYTVSIAHMESIAKKRKHKSGGKSVKDGNELREETSEEIHLDEQDEVSENTSLKPDVSLIELADWLKVKMDQQFRSDTLPGFTALRNVNASAQEVAVVQNDITRPIQAPFKAPFKAGTKKSQPLDTLARRKPFDRKFNEHSILAEALDLCIMAWSCIHNPNLWGSRTIRGIYEASQDLTFDSLLAASDSSVANMTDGLLDEFDIGNYRFYAVFAPIHVGKLYATRGWNLAMSVKKIFHTAIYTGAVLVCGKAHIGLMKVESNFYAWWGVTGTKNLRIVVSEDLQDFLKLIVQEINEAEEIDFQMRVITISYARKLDPDCTDIGGLHELVAATSLPQIHRKEGRPYDLESLYRPIAMNSVPFFICGSVGLEDRDAIREPKVKRCYFIAVLAVMVKRDIMQSLLPTMIDKVIEVGESLYREFNEPKYHTEHILRNVTIMNRIFDFRDVASELHIFTENPQTGEDDFDVVLKKEFNKFFKYHTHGVLHFSNCCYGFWNYQSTDTYIYLDPYGCNKKGKRVAKGGHGCLSIFPSISQMVKSISLKRAPDTTGFFIHRLHVESINMPPSMKFEEDPMWIYLDYHWSVTHAPGFVKKKKKPRKKTKTFVDVICHEAVDDRVKKASWNNYAIEIENMIYSLWGTLGPYNRRFGVRAGKNQAAICVAALAMQYLCHPSKWSAAILDSAVICGDCYYTESLKSANYKKHSNTFNLQPCFKVLPYIWIVEYGAKMCGMIYGGNGMTSLAATLKLALRKSSNVLIECDKITLAILFANDGYYAIDPCWTGPPLFPPQRGALYALRCRNLNALMYVLVKMINTNQRREFTATPVGFSFKHETCVSSDQKPTKKTILLDPVESKPGVAVMAPCVPVAGAITVADEDFYLQYQKNVERGIKCGAEFVNPLIPSPLPALSDDNARNMRISTAWHKNLGKTKRFSSVLNSLSTRNSQQDRKRSRCSGKLGQNDDYPYVVDLTDDKHVEKSSKVLTARSIVAEKPPDKPLDCLPPRKFILNRSKKEFDKQITEMTDESYKIYKHRVILQGNDEVIIDKTKKRKSNVADVL